MASYRFRCPIDTFEFTVEQPMAETTRTVPCPCHGAEAPKVLGAAMQFTYGRAEFHDGPQRDGKTVNETAKEWRAAYKARTGEDPVPAGSRWI